MSTAIRVLFEKVHNDYEPTEENRYRVVSLPEMPHKIGCSEQGYPKFFVVTSDHSSMLHNLNAELLSVEYDMVCNIIEDDKCIDSERFTIITLRSENEQLQSMFVDVFYMMLSLLPQKPTNLAIAAKIEQLLSIFSKIKKKPLRKLQGLWAELLIIEQSKDPVTMARAWHSQPEAKYDFTMGQDKLEVKSTSGENRIHRFSLDQLNPSDSSRLLIASVITRESAKDQNGLSVYDLYDSISLKIKDDKTKIHVYDVMVDTLGSDFNVARRRFFDYSEACDRLAFFDHKDIPKILKEHIPPLVTEVKFSAGLSHLTDIREKGFDRGDSSLYYALY